MDKSIILWLLAASVVGLSNGQDNCIYLNISWVSTQPNYEVGADGTFSLNVDRNIYTGASTINVILGAGLPYNLLFIQAHVRGGTNNVAVGTWKSEGTAHPIHCGAVSNSLTDTETNQAGSRTFTWTAPPPSPTMTTSEIEFRATVIDNQGTVWFGFISIPITYSNPCEDPFPCQNSGNCILDRDTITYTCLCVNGYTGANCQVPPSSNCNGVSCQNGGTCTGGTPICNCLSGWTGTYCETSITNPCSGVNCLNGGVCTVSGSNAVCNCLSGWTGQFCHVAITNPCSSHLCQNGGACIPSGSTYTCSCLTGWTGQFCQFPTTAPSSCSPNPCRNDGTCQDSSNNPNGYICLCGRLFEGENCEMSRPEPCHSQPCQNGGECLNLNSQTDYIFLCDCVYPWTNTTCEDMLPPDVCSPDCVNGQCVNRVCQCNEGWTGNDCNTEVSPDVCNPDCVNGQCVNQVCQCNEGWTGNDCNTEESLCDPNPCGDGTCLLQADRQSYLCRCFDMSETMNKPCPTACSTGPCQNGGICYNRDMPMGDDPRYLCVCAPGFTGENCQDQVVTPSPTIPTTVTSQQPSTLNPCNQNPCMNDGVCTPVGGDTYVCACPNTHTGVICEITVTTSPPTIPTTAPTEPSTPNPCNQNPCVNDGVCSPLGGTDYNCACPDTHTGINCETPVTTQSPPGSTTISPTTQRPTTSSDPCLSNPCMHEGTCQQSGSAYTCSCVEGFSGPRCEEDPCSSSPCQNGGDCSFTTQGEMKCECADGYEGTSCENNIDECNSNPCQNGGLCRDQVNGYQCQCSSDFVGDNCERARVCENYCMNGGECQLLSQTNNPFCTCTDGYIGTQCHFAPCTEQYCRNGGTCSIQEVGINEFQYNCDCVQGFKGSTCDQSVTCADLPCLNGATCETAVDSVVCQCAPGFNGSFCEQDIDECVSNPCRNNGDCKNMENGYQCDCPNGYSGTNCEIESGEDFCVAQPCSENSLTCLSSQRHRKALCVCKNYYRGNFCEEKVTFNNRNQANSRTEITVGGLKLQPWWIALICLILLLFFAFIIIVICVQQRERTQERQYFNRTPSGSKSLIY